MNLFYKNSIDKLRVILLLVYITPLITKLRVKPSITIIKDKRKKQYQLANNTNKQIKKKLSLDFYLIFNLLLIYKKV